jgi:hypothetical protein
MGKILTFMEKNLNLMGKNPRLRENIKGTVPRSFKALP